MAYRITLKNGDTRWIVKYRDQHGKQIPRRFNTRAEAKRFEGEIANLKLGGRPAPNKAPTLEAYVKDIYWPEYAQVHLEQKTRATYASNLRLRILPDLGVFKVSKITRKLLDGYVAELSRSGIGNRAIQSTMTTLSSILERCVEQDYLTANPARGVKTPKIQTRQPLIVTDNQIKRLADHAPTHRDRAIILVAAYTGMRQGEVFALRWEDVHDKHITVRGSVDSDQSIKATKSGRDRSVPLLPEAKAAIDEWRLLAPGTSWVFPSSMGTPIHKSNWHRRVWQDVRKKAKVPELKFHDLRHTFVSRLIREGVDPVRVAYWAGHSSTRTTLDVYAHLFDAELGFGDTKKIPVDSKRGGLGG